MGATARGRIFALVLALAGCGARNELPIPRGLEGDGGASSSASITAGGGGGVVGPCASEPGRVILAEGQASARAIALFGDSLYFRASNQVRRVSRCGGPVATVAEAPGGFELDASALGVAFDTNHPAKPSGIALLRGGVGPAELVATAPGDAALRSPALDDAGVAWLEWGQQGAGSRVRRLVLDGGSSPVTLGEYSPLSYVGPLAEHGDWVHFARGFGASATGPVDLLHKTDALSATTEPSTLPLAMVAGAEGLYAGYGHGQNEARRFDPATGALLGVLATSGPVVGLATDGARVFFAVTASSDDSAEIFSASRELDDVALFAAVESFGGMTLDGDWVYATLPGAGVVQRFSRAVP